MNRKPILRHKRSALLLAILGLLAACSMAPPLPTATPTPKLYLTSVPGLTATALAQNAPLLATLTARETFAWRIGFGQAGAMQWVEGDEIQLQRQPFTLTLALSKPVAVYLNVQDTATNYEKIQPGLAVNDGCVSSFYPFCSLLGMVVAVRPGELVVDKQDEEAILGFVLDPQLGKDGTQFTLTQEGVVYERYMDSVSLLGVVPPSPRTPSPHVSTELPIEQFTGAQLYFVFFADYYGGETIAADELQKFVVTLR